MTLAAPTLRRTMTIVVVTLALLAAIASAALVGLTRVLHHADARSDAAVLSVQLAEEAQRDLLLHDRVANPALRAQLADGMHGRLTAARERVSSVHQQKALVAAEEAVGAYLRVQEEPGSPREESAAKHATAFASLDSLVELNLAEARRANDVAERLDGLALLIGVAVGTGVSLASIVVLWWVHRRALRPLTGLAVAMRRFGQGDIEERASEQGPAELAEMAQQFNAMADAIARQRKERQAFIASVVHDLRNPLSALRMANQLVQGTNGHQLGPERAARVRDTVARQIDRLERMVGDLLDSVSVEAGKVQLRLARHDASAIVLEVAEHYRRTTDKHTLVVDVPAGGVFLECDPMRVEQILSNLVSNAIKYSPGGGRITIALTARERDVLLRVSDEGVGMTEEDAATAFEPFRRSARVTDQFAGSGLGLFVVRRLVEAHGGHIDLQTSLGAGSTFEVCVPVRVDARAHASATAASSSARTNGDTEVSHVA